MALGKNVIIVSIAVSVLGLLSAILGFAAQATKTRVSDLVVVSGLYTYGCVHSTSPALRLALGAALLILISQITISIFIGCGFCNQRGQQFSVPAQGGNKRNIAIILFIISWVTFSTCLKYFVVGAKIEERGTNGNVDYSCSLVSRQFAIGASMALTTINLSVGAYILLNSSYCTQAGGIAMCPPSQTPQIAVAQQFAPGVPEPQKPSQAYYPPPNSVAGYGYNTQSYA
ncbi:hypothetical protein LUZ62_036191 [Rhynchospora pubera]|uniref:Uncharacterized protein n=1 Tax=Rhynchospora pubera TaxID=906938 RepID=A0AAV8EXQ7_9POAL|nr:hypothetical protein LUZ62_036191 [Rhynchospora pubera]